MSLYPPLFQPALQQNPILPSSAHPQANRLTLQGAQSQACTIHTQSVLVTQAPFCTVLTRGPSVTAVAVRAYCNTRLCRTTLQKVHSSTCSLGAHTSV